MSFKCPSVNRIDVQKPIIYRSINIYHLGVDLFVGVVIVLYLDSPVNIARNYGMIERDPRKMVIVDHARPEGKSSGATS
jgi:hypothetical protein